MVPPEQPVILHAFLILALVTFSILSLSSIRSNHKDRKWTSYIPPLSVLIYILYEGTMPGQYDIRIDLLLIIPLLLICIFTPVVKFIFNSLFTRK